MAFDGSKLPIYPTPKGIPVPQIVTDTALLPQERIKSYSSEQFEAFITEWVASFRNEYEEVRQIGGAGDLGRDALAKDKFGKWTYYQCKHYTCAISADIFMLEMGKLIWYTFHESMPLPKKYYLIALNGFSKTVEAWLQDTSKINEYLISCWDSNCKNKINSSSCILSQDIMEYITNFDFSVVGAKGIEQIVEEHKKTAFFALRFGGELTVTRKNVKPPSSIQKEEDIYIRKILDAFEEYYHISISDISDIPNEFFQELTDNREWFFYAESLRLFTKDNLLLEESFNELKEEMRASIINVIRSNYPNGLTRLREVLKHSAQTIPNNILTKYSGLVGVRDKQGLCHHLANERDEIRWVK